MLKTHKGKDFRQLRGEIIECLTIIAEAVGTDNFRLYSNLVIESLFEYQTELEYNNLQNIYFLSGLQRLVIVMQKDFVQFLPKVMPQVLSFLNKTFEEQNKNFMNDHNINEQSNIKENSSNNRDDIEQGLNLMNALITIIKEDFKDYIEISCKMIIPLINHNSNENIRKAASKCLPKIISSVKGNFKLCSSITKSFIVVLWSAISIEYSTDILIDQFLSMADCLTEIGKEFLTDIEINEFNEKIMEQLINLDNRKKENEKMKEQEDIEYNEIELLEEDCEVENDLSLAIAELIGILVKFHPEKMYSFLEILFNQLIIKIFNNDKIHNKTIKFALLILNYNLEFYDFNFIQKKFAFICDKLIKYAVNPCYYIKIVASQGISHFIRLTPNFYQYANIVLEIINKGLKKNITQFEDHIEEEEEELEICRENFVANLGKIIKYHIDYEKIKEIMHFWVENLPIKFDEEIGLEQHELLLFIILNKPELILNENNVKKIITIYGQILNTKTCNEEIEILIKKSLEILKKEEGFFDHWEFLTSNLDKNQIENISKFLF